MPSLHLTIDDGVAKVVFDLPGETVNKLSRSVGKEIQDMLEEVATNTAVRSAVLLSGKPGSFIAGADIEEFVALGSREEALDLVRRGQALISRFGQIGKPVVAAIHGVCLGGGLEAALACAYRVATDHPTTKIGLPEVQLGIIPAAGGCQRLPRLIGVRAALDIILAGKTVPARRAFRSGIVDELVHPAILEDVAVHAARRLANGWRAPRDRGGLMSALLDRNPAGRLIVFRTASRQVAKRTGGHYPAPIAALDAVEWGLRNGIEAGLDREAQHFATLASGNVSRHLVQIFFATTELKKDPGVPPPAPKPRDVRAVGIIGAGFMGSAIGGTAVLRAQVDVRLRDEDLERVQSGIGRAQDMLANALKRRRITKFEHRRLGALVSGGVDWSGFGRSDIIIEAVFEDLRVKQTVFREVSPHVRETCVLASNTSTIPIAQIANVIDDPGRVLGMHFFSPVEKMPLLEIIVTERTFPWAVVTALEFGRRLGKTCIVVRDHPGFWVNRILAPYLNEAGMLLSDGVPIEQIDRTMRKFGFPVGPINLLDEVGLDVAQKAAVVMHEAFGDRMRPATSIARLVGDGRFGRKSGSGFYQYKGGKRQGVDPAAVALIDVAPRPVPDKDVERRLIYAMLNEAATALADDVVRTPRDGDVGAIFGFGFPPFLGGPFRFMDTLGINHVRETLEQLQNVYGDRFAPTSLVRDMAASAGTFYS